MHYLLHNLAKQLQNNLKPYPELRMSPQGMRGASAAESRQALQRLTRLLSPPPPSPRGGRRNARPILDPNNDRHRADATSHSHAELRSAYLRKLQEIHPDKFAHRRSTTSGKSADEKGGGESDRPRRGEGELLGGGGESAKIRRRAMFAELRDAWSGYEEVAKRMGRVVKGDGMGANFTHFGVGCSFSDSPEETERRGDIMDQAGRGWFTSGLLAERAGEEEIPSRVASGGGDLKLCDDDLFVVDDGSYGDDDHRELKSRLSEDCVKKRSLVDHIIPKGRVATDQP